ncbi:MAG: hypothetical protein J6C37_00315 [Roseburia sp.]|nr:hypothetical protein [Roseburia sp.]
MTNEELKNVETELKDWELWMENILRNRCLVEYIRRNYRFHTGRLEILNDIFGRIEAGNEEELITRIYEYGSMIKRQDFIARQMFLWLFAIAEEKFSDKKIGVEMKQFKKEE